MYRKIMDLLLSKISKANVAYLKILFKKYHMKSAAYSSHIFFVKTCLNEKLTPNFIRAKVYSDSTISAGKATPSIHIKNFVALK